MTGWRSLRALVSAAVSCLAAGPALAEDWEYFVDGTVATSGNGTPDAPWKTIGEALAAGRAQSGNHAFALRLRVGHIYNTPTHDWMLFNQPEDQGDAWQVTGWFRPGDDDDAVATLATAGGAWGNPRLAPGCEALRVTLGPGVAITSDAGVPTIYITTSNVSLTLDGCSVTSPSYAVCCTDATQSVSITIRNGARVASTDNHAISVASLKSLIVTDSTLTTTGASRYILSTGNSPGGISERLQFHRCAVSSAAGFIHIGWSTTGTVAHYLAQLDLRDNVIDIAGIGLAMHRYVRRACIEGNTFTNRQSGAAGTIVLGFDSGTPADTFATGGIIVRNNLVQNVGSNGGHGIEIAKGISGAVCSGNTVLDCDYGIVIKGDNVAVDHNCVVSRAARTLQGACLHLSGGQGNTLRHNSLYSTIANSAIEIKKNLESVMAVNNVVEGNIVHVTNAGAVCVVVETLPGFDTNRIDGNVYWLSGNARFVANTGNAGGCTYHPTVASLQTFWAGCGCWPDNELRSVMADPRFRAPDQADLRLIHGSPACGTRRSFWHNYGAWQQPESIGDFDDDGDVDMADFKVFHECFNGPNRPSACCRYE